MSQFSPKGFIDESGTAHLTRENDVGDSHLTMNSGSTEPSYKLKGTLWLDDSVTPNIIKIYDGADWVPLMQVDLSNDRAAIHVANYAQNSAPSNPVVGTQWLDTTATPWIWKMYDGACWITLGTVNATTNLFAADSATALVDQGSGGGKVEVSWVNTGVWDMDTNPSPGAIASPIPTEKIISVTGYISDDAETTRYPFTHDPTGTADLYIQKWQQAGDQIIVGRANGGIFDGSLSFDDGVINRGEICIIHAP